MKHAKDKKTSQKEDELKKFIDKHNKLNTNMTIVLDEERNRIQFNCTKHAKNQILCSINDDWSSFRRRVFLKTKNILHVITDDELEFNYPELNSESTEELFSNRGIFICYLNYNKLIEYGFAPLKKWLIDSCA